MRRPPLHALLATVLALGVIGLTPAVGSAEPTPPPDARADSKLGLSPGMREALRRDLDLTDAQIADRLRTEAAAPVVEKRLRKQLGSTFGGAWIGPGDSRLTVAVTDRSAAAAVRAEGAEPVVVERSAKELSSVQAKLDRRAGQAPAVVHGWHVDPASNAVVITVEPGAEAEAKRFAERSGAGKVTVRASADRLRPVYDIRGGDEYRINGNVLCSVGFAVSGGFVTAGHCGQTGSPTTGSNGQAQGTFAGSSFPGNDYAWVRTNGNWVSRPWVTNYADGNVLVAGAQEAAIGSSVCRSGRTTQWRCGTLLGRNETVNYTNGAVYGLSRSNACAAGGDSGGAFLAGNQAQGVTSGAGGNCSTGGTTVFQPLNEVLQTYGLALTTAGGGSGGGTGAAIVSNWHNKCLDVPGGNFSDGIAVQMWDCNGSPAQRWEAVNGTLRTGNGKCLDVPYGSTANGAGLQIANCSGNPAQQWVLSAAGDLVNPQANKCIDIRDWNAGNGARLQLWECSGNANQKWRRG